MAATRVTDWRFTYFLWTQRKPGTPAAARYRCLDLLTPHARAALITAARKEFVRAGIRGARIEDITAACGLSKGAFYLHALSKEALFGELVTGLQDKLEAALDERQARWRAFFEKNGPLAKRDLKRKSRHYQAFVALETSLDRELIELIWQHRDLFEILFSGAQGTEFSGLIWSLVDRESERVAKDFSMLQAAGTCRTDIPPRLFGSLLVGAWLVIARQMARLPEQPDLDEWVHALHRLFREGSLKESHS